MIEIEKDIPIPEVLVKGQSKYPFAQMEPGDSIFVSNPKCNSFSTLTKRLRNKGWGFTSRAENGGVRIWRYK